MRLAARIVTAITPPLLAAILLLGAWGLPARAQPAPPTPPPIAVKGGNATLAVSGSTARVALPSTIATFPVGLFVNDGASEIFINVGGNAVTAATTNFAIPVGCSVAFFLPNGSTSVAAITAGGVSTLQVSQWNGAPWFGACSAGSGGGGSVTQGTSPWIIGLTPLTPVVVGSAVSSSVLKNAAGNLVSVYAISTVSGYLMVFNSTSAPSNGATTAGVASGNMVECIGPSTQPFAHFGDGPLEVYSVGITAVFSSTGCATLTLSATAFIHGVTQ